MFSLKKQKENVSSSFLLPSGGGVMLLHCGRLLLGRPPPLPGVCEVPREDGPPPPLLLSQTQLQVCQSAQAGVGVGEGWQLCEGQSQSGQLRPAPQILEGITEASTLNFLPNVTEL